MRVLKAITLFAILSATFISCSTDNNEDIASKEEVMLKNNSNYAIQNFESALRKVSSDVKNIVDRDDFNKNPEAYEKELQIVLNPLVSPSKDLIKMMNITEAEVPGIHTSFTEHQTIATGLLIYSQQTADSDPSVLDCVARAFVGLELHEGFWSSFTNRRVLIKAVGKVASRYLGAIGAALIVYDFVDCMEWI